MDLHVATRVENVSEKNEGMLQRWMSWSRPWQRAGTPDFVVCELRSLDLNLNNEPQRTLSTQRLLLPLLGLCALCG